MHPLAFISGAHRPPDGERKLIKIHKNLHKVSFYQSVARTMKFNGVDAICSNLLQMRFNLTEVE